MDAEARALSFALGRPLHILAIRWNESYKANNDVICVVTADRPRLNLSTIAACTPVGFVVIIRDQYPTISYARNELPRGAKGGAWLSPRGICELFLPFSGLKGRS
jgi:hypothetical protein